MNNTNIAPSHAVSDHQANEQYLASDILSEEGLAEFNNRLHEFLDFYQLFDTFINELRATIACDSIEYEDESTQTTLVNGNTGKHLCEYALKYDGLSLGDIKITRDTKFSSNELDLIDVMLAGLILPLRNALRYQQAIRLAQRDELTGLRNGSYYHDTINLEIERARRYKIPFSLLMFDLDDFEKINETYGREAGDMVLLDVARRIEGRARGSDVVYRNGGDEFLVFLPNTEKDEAMIVAQRIKDAVLNKACAYDNNDIFFTLSAGVVTVTHGDTAGKLIERADKAIFHAKILGKDRIYYDSMTESGLIAE
ncbi:hypothetical protein MNBD_GAMMA05-1526 [hydrothermal vent metagenome]|uniref:GGDEF domain-containing protein n=1 Tax=hydrothermal vent metagenome TaxID=652676 RepID=A0A3B0WSR2_9ZZZZ